MDEEYESRVTKNVRIQLLLYPELLPELKCMVKGKKWF